MVVFHQICHAFRAVTPGIAMQGVIDDEIEWRGHSA